jgi:O-succinylbenzoate synthase
VRHALDLGACKIINIKMGRVGGILEAKRIHDYCLAKGVPVWCGGMLETGIGRAANIALSTLKNFSLPGDVSASRRYFERDTILPPVEVSSDGLIGVPTDPGLGYRVDTDWIDSITVRTDSCT